ncbi:hypothetical protein FRC02_010018 [Tulasnella sp. 418]|nr:hypothetical protein FRC02_010018 [Tulasnella sp. 418]
MSDLASSTHKLEPFRIMAKSAKGAAAAKLIENATGAPGVFVFGELLDLPNIQELESNPTQAPYLSLLKLFAYGTYEEYKQHKDTLPPLNADQITKLRNLSIVSLASQARILPYSQLRSYLDITTIRELEDLIIDAMYQDVLRGKLDQKEQHLEIEYTMGRDLRPGQLAEILGALKNWSKQTSDAITLLDNKINEIAAQKMQDAADAELYENAKNAVLTDILLTKKANTKRGFDAPSGGKSAPIYDDEMDVDSPIERGGGGGGVFSNLKEYATRKK